MRQMEDLTPNELNSAKHELDRMLEACGPQHSTLKRKLETEIEHIRQLQMNHEIGVHK